ncbi:uncharacterized protein M6B38_195125 [Iris pallida]|uniref:Uncharacterized protein n=1 Tax=Iris pallida TaxID=29817 RepID=A0AAX6EDD6_IRIPA|nr:uncharacterized protein M6B38_195125 [Iris pallida]
MKLGFSHAHATSRDIWVSWDSSLTTSVVADHAQVVTLTLVHTRLREQVMLSIVHGGRTTQLTRSLWEELLRVRNSFPSLPLISTRNFNAISSSVEKSGSLLPSSRSMREFNHFVGEANPTAIPFHGRASHLDELPEGQNRQLSRLDRALANPQWYDLVHSSEESHLNRFKFDHSPLLLEIIIDQPRIKKSFRYLNCWSSHIEFLEIVETTWTSVNHSKPLKRVAFRLKTAQNALSQWSRHSFRDIFQSLRDAEDEVTQVELAFDITNSPVLRSSLNKARAHLKLCIANELSFWKQKARLRWDVA